MEAVLEQREKTLSEIAYDVYIETGSCFAVASIFCFLKRNRLEKVCLIFFSALDSIFHEPGIYFTNQLNKISLKSLKKLE